MQTGDVVFVRGNTWVSKLIRLIDKGRFSHVALAISNERVIEANYNIRVSINPLHYDEYEIVPMHLTEEQKKLVTKAMKKYKGKWYDFLLALTIPTRWLRIDNPDYVICSELTMDILKEVGIIEPYVGDLTPNELYNYLIIRNR